MTTERSADGGQASVRVQNIAGIEHTDIDLSPGITTLAGQNATNRTSLLLALNEALGGSLGSVKRESESQKGRSELAVGDDTHFRALARRESTVSREGSPYTDKASIVDLYVSLLEHNEIRRLIESGDIETINTRLADLLMAPVDTDTIQAEIEERQQRKREIEADLQAIEAAKEELPELERRRQTKQDAIETLKSEIDAKREAIANLDIDREDAEQAEKQLDELQTAQEEYRNIETTIERKERTLEESRQRMADRREELANVEQQLEETSAPDEEAIEALNDRRERMSRVASLLDGVVEASRALVNADHSGNLREILQVEEDLTAVLDPASESVCCPTCGSTVEQAAIRDRIEDLQATATRYHNKAEEIEERQSELRSQQQQLNRLHQERESLENDIRRLEHRIDEDERRIEDLNDDLEDKQTEIDNLREQVEETREQRNRELEVLYDEIADLQGKRADAEAELERIESQIAKHESTVADERTLREEKTQLEEEIEEYRRRVTTLEERVQESASEEMEKLVDRLDYDRIEGIRLDRKPSEDPAAISEFELVVARHLEDGVVTREHDLTTLSESERSLVGLVVALAAYIAHGVSDEVPFLLVDSIEQFDASRINRLLRFVHEEVDVTYIVAALLPEDAGSITADHTKVEADVLL